MNYSSACPITNTSILYYHFQPPESRSPPVELAPIKMEVGIEECLHIEFEYDKQM